MSIELAEAEPPYWRYTRKFPAHTYTTLLEFLAHTCTTLLEVQTKISCTHIQSRVTDYGLILCVAVCVFQCVCCSECVSATLHTQGFYTYTAAEEPYASTKEYM